MQVCNPPVQNPKLLSPLTLAYLGDAVFELCARRQVVLEGNMPVNQLHKKGVDMVRATAQAAGFERIRAYLSEEELDIFRRGRNAGASSVPKHTSVSDYRCATGVEALFGYLYLKGEQQRVDELFSRMQDTQESL